MEKNFKVQYKWDLEDPKKIEPSSEDLEYLEEAAFERIFEMKKEGYSSGELHTYLPDGETPVWGWWHFSEDK